MNVEKHNLRGKLSLDLLQNTQKVQRIQKPLNLSELYLTGDNQLK